MNLMKKITGTRDRIIQLLRKKQYTVEQLGKELGISETAIRSQLAVLQRDGIVEPKEEIKIARRPSLTYGLSSGVGLYFSKAYHLVLAHLIELLSHQLPEKEYTTFMKKLGRKLADATPQAKGKLQDRVKSAAKFYESFGTLTDIEDEDGKFIIKAHGCPFEAVVNGDAGICMAMESFMSRHIGASVRQCCDRGENASCRFEVKKPPERIAQVG